MRDHRLVWLAVMIRPMTSFISLFWLAPLIHAASVLLRFCDAPSILGPLLGFSTACANGRRAIDARDTAGESISGGLRVRGMRGVTSSALCHCRRCEDDHRD